MTRSLFSDLPTHEPIGNAPLAERMRPHTLNEVLGQSHLIEEGRVLHDMIERNLLVSIILWGPPGTGKTTLARLIAKSAKASFISYSAVLSGIREIKSVMAAAEKHYRYSRDKTIIFIDEIHRFNKAQQDAFLSYIESGVIVLIGATTENPSFEIISALLSRAKVYVLKSLSPEDIKRILVRALEDPLRGLGARPVKVGPELIDKLALYANGDARIALNTLEIAVSIAGGRNVTEDDLTSAMQKKFVLYDKAGEEHYNLISALHKSLRNSDTDASLYWLGRMLEAGEDPVCLARRMVRFASEDVGMADVRALAVTLNAAEAVRIVGLPECKLALAQAAVYLSVAPKSNALYTAYSEVVTDVQNTLNEPPPLHILNAPTHLMKDLGYGRNYEYAHDLENKVADMECLPETLRGRQYYKPTDEGLERRIKEALQAIKEKKKQKQN